MRRWLPAVVAVMLLLGLAAAIFRPRSRPSTTRVATRSVMTLEPTTTSIAVPMTSTSSTSTSAVTQASVTRPPPPTSPKVALAKGPFVTDTSCRGLYVLDPDAETAVKVAAVPTEGLWSPDGKHLSYYEAQHGIHVVDPDGRNDRLAVDDAAVNSDGLWSPDGQSLLWIRFTPDDHQNPRIMITPSRGGEATPVATAELPGTQLGWSPDGKRIVYGTIAGNGHLRVVDLSTGADTVVTTRSTLGPPAWSPDGTSILDFADGAVYAFDAGGNGERRIAPVGTPFQVWLGRTDLISIAGEDPNAFAIDTVHADGSGRRTIAHGESMAWTADGRQVAFTHRDGTHFNGYVRNTYVANADGTGQRQVTRDVDANPMRLTWSPDGHRLAFACRQPT